MYINILFQGAQNLFISQLKTSQHVKVLARTDTLGLDAQIDEPDSSSSMSNDDAEDSDIEAQLEAFMGQAFQPKPPGEAGSPADQDASNPQGVDRIDDSDEELTQVAEIKPQLKMPHLNIFKERNEFDPIFQGERGKIRKKRTDKGELAVSGSGKNSSDIDSVSIDTHSSLDEKNNKKMAAIESEGSLSNSDAQESDDEQDEADELVKMDHRFVLGMLSSNRELFLFDRQVKMGKNVENWLINVEDAMRVSIKKHMKNALLRFASQPIEEWIGDYPQQVCISVIHLVIAQEINDTLSNIDFDAPDIQNADSRALFHESKVTIGKDNLLAKALATQQSGQVSARSKKSLASGE